MTRGVAAVPTPFAAAQVVGHTPDGSIDALEAGGTTRDGEIVLRVTVPGDASRPQELTTCYRYRFRHTLDDDRPTQLDTCPARPALRLPDPSTLPAVTEATRMTVLRTLTGLPMAQRTSPAGARAAVRRRIGTSYGVTALADPRNGVSLRVEAYGTCFMATTLPVRAGRVLTGLECQA